MMHDQGNLCRERGHIADKKVLKSGSLRNGCVNIQLDLSAKQVMCNI